MWSILLGSLILYTHGALALTYTNGSSSATSPAAVATTETGSGTGISTVTPLPLDPGVTCGGCQWANVVNVMSWRPQYTYTATTVFLVINETNNSTSTSTVLGTNTSIPATLNADVTVTGTVASDVYSGHALFFTYPTSYDEQAVFSATFSSLITIYPPASEPSLRPMLSCSTYVRSNYTEAFAIPLVNSVENFKDPAASSFLAFVSSAFPNCTFKGDTGVPIYHVGVSALTVTSSTHVGSAVPQTVQPAAPSPVLGSPTPVVTQPGSNPPGSSVSLSPMQPNPPSPAQSNPTTQPQPNPASPAQASSPQSVQPNPSPQPQPNTQSQTPANPSSPIQPSPLTQPQPSTAPQAVASPQAPTDVAQPGQPNPSVPSGVNSPPNGGPATSGISNPNSNPQPASGALAPGSVITINNQPIVVNSASQIIASGQTLQPGSPPITIGGTQISLGPSASNIVVGGTTAALPSAAAAPPPPAAVITFNNEPITANAASQFVIGSQTIAPGAAAVTIAGTPISLGPSASQIVVDGSTSIITLSIAPPAAAPIITINNQPVAANTALQYVVGSQTLIPGGPQITISGTPVSLAPSATQIVIGGSPIPLAQPANAPLPALTVGGVTASANSASQYIFGSQILSPGSAIAVSGTPISLAPSATQVVIGSSTVNLFPGSQITPPPALTVGGQTFTANVQSQYIIGGQTLAPGAAITYAGTVVSLAPGASAVVIGGSTLALISGSAPAPLTFDGQIVNANSASQYIIAGQTLSPGSVITVSGTIISLAPSASNVVIGGTTIPLTSPTGLPAIAVAGQTITANSASQYVVAGQTLSPGSAITVSGTVISLTPSASALVINGVTTPIIPGNSRASITSPPTLTLAGQPATANKAGNYAIAGQTLTPGSPALIISGTTYSLAPSASALVVNGRTTPISNSAAKTTSPPLLTIGAQTITANAQGNYVVAGQTLTPGGAAITVSGATISLAPSYTALVVNAVTTPLNPLGPGATTTGLGVVIMSGFGGATGGTGSVNGTGGVVGFKGGAGRMSGSWWVVSGLAGVVGVGYFWV